MICVSIGRGRHKHMIAEHRHLVEEGAELVELRLDYINGDVNLKRVIADRPCPVIITCRRERDGGKWTGDESTRITLLKMAIAEGVEYVDLEEDVAGDIPRFGQTRRIVSMHDFRQTPDDLPGVIRRLAAKEADIVKVATMANAPQDNLRMLRAVRDAGIPTVGMCMGDMGTPSRILAARFGSPFTYATFHHDRTMAPGQLSFPQMKEIYRYDKIDRQTEVFGVIADPIGHSHSPVIHNASFAEAGMNRVYVPFRVPKEDLEAFLDDAMELGVKGLSVTIPHKEAVISKLSKIDGAAKAIGAVNTIIYREGELVGYNTDYRAAMDGIDTVLGASGRKAPLAKKVALLLGAGGVAKAICFGLKRRGADVVIANRTFERAEDLAAQMQCRAIEWDRRHSVAPTLLVNCTPVGMHPNVNESPFEKHSLRPHTLVFDTVYNPEHTLLIKDALERNCRVITGVSMFIHQAALQFKHFTGVDAPMDAMRAALKEATAAVRVKA